MNGPYGGYKPTRDAESSMATAALEDAQWQRSQATRLGTETSVATQIAAEVFRALVSVDRAVAERICRSLTSQFGRYKGSEEFPNLSELLGAFDAEVRSDR